MLELHQAHLIFFVLRMFFLHFLADTSADIALWDFNELPSKESNFKNHAKRGYTEALKSFCFNHWQEMVRNWKVLEDI